jgi:homoaconitate hydratase
MRFVPSLAFTYGNRRLYATVVGGKQRSPQTIIEKVVQKYAVGLNEGKTVKAGDYVMIRPEHVMTHDNTGPVISKSVLFCYIDISIYLPVAKVQVHWCF